MKSECDLFGTDCREEISTGESRANTSDCTKRLLSAFSISTIFHYWNIEPRDCLLRVFVREGFITPGKPLEIVLIQS